MGANARRRATEKDEAKAAAPSVVRFRQNPTRTAQRLQQKAQEIQTLQQLEEIIAEAHEDHRGAVRNLLERAIRPDLPCCGVAMLAQRIGDSSFQHGARCPARNRVTLQ